MWSVGVLLSELAHENGPSFFDRVWPFFLAVAAVFVLAAAYMGLRREKEDGGSRGSGAPPDGE